MTNKPSNKNKKQKPAKIAVNRKARHDFMIENSFETGMVLEGWEVKSLRAGKVNLSDTYVRIIKNEAWLLGLHITPLATASTHINPDPTRVRKLLLNRNELDTLIGAVERKGYTLIALSMYWKNGRAKLEVALGKGKKNDDKRATDKQRDWNRQKARILKGR